MPVQQTLTSFFTRSRPAKHAVDVGPVPVDGPASASDPIHDAPLYDNRVVSRSSPCIDLTAEPPAGRLPLVGQHVDPSSEGPSKTTSSISLDDPVLHMYSIQQALPFHDKRKRKAFSQFERPSKLMRTTSSLSTNGVLTGLSVTDAPHAQTSMIDPQSSRSQQDEAPPPILGWSSALSDSLSGEFHPSSELTSITRLGVQNRAEGVTDRKGLGTREEPIIIEDSPIEKKTLLLPAHPFFTKKPPLTSSVVERRESNRGVPWIRPVPWPTSGNQHVKGVSSTLQPRDSKFKVKVRMSNVSHSPDEPAGSQAFNYRELLAPSLADPASAATEGSVGYAISSDGDNHVPPSPTHNDSDSVHPSQSPLGDDAELWVEKYRPRRASEVLGNEPRAQYLKAWLHALELHLESGLEKCDESLTLPPVIAGNQKIVHAMGKELRTRFSTGEDDRFVQDDVDDDEGHSEPKRQEAVVPPGLLRSTDQNMPLSLGGTRVSSGEDLPHEPSEPVFDFSGFLANVILLSGPSGGGKTACVYACAHELGWEVFEVYPGVGKRSGAAVTALVGAVAKNHMVKRGSIPKTKESAIEQLFRRDKIPTDTFLKDQHATSMVESGTSDAGNGSGVGQSLILLEEVDILLREDTGFWPAVVNMAKESRRPIVMTCNDWTLVPQNDLSLQRHLVFEPPEAAQEVSYLQQIARAEGYDISRDSAARIRDARGDLRKSINALQWACSGQLTNAPSESRGRRVLPPPEERGDQGSQSGAFQLRAYEALMDCASYTEAFLSRSAYSQAAAQEMDRYQPSADDEQGPSLLMKPAPRESDVALWTSTRDEVFAQEVEHAAVGYYGRLVPAIEDGKLAETSEASMEALLEYLTPLIPISSYLLPSSAVVVDYAPYVRAMVLADDAAAAAAAEGRGRAMVSRAGRPVRMAATRQASQPYARWIILDERELARARGDGVR